MPTLYQAVHNNNNNTTPRYFPANSSMTVNGLFPPNTKSCGNYQTDTGQFQKCCHFIGIHYSKSSGDDVHLRTVGQKNQIEEGEEKENTSS